MKPFDLVVYAIAALALLFVALTIMNMVMPKADPQKNIQQGLAMAQLPSNVGKLVTLGMLTFEKETNFSKSAVGSTDISLAFECTSPTLCCNLNDTCARPIEWNQQKVAFKQREDIYVSTRCTMNFSTPVCKVYFGQLPAQAHIASVKFMGKTTDGYTIQTTIDNKGDSDLLFAEHTIELYKKANNEWQQLIDTNVGTIDTLMPNQTRTFLWQIPTPNKGEYKVVAHVTTTNGGFDQNFVTFTIASNPVCMTVAGVGNTYANETNTGYIEERSCSGCTYGYECQSAWQAKEPQKTWIAGTNTIAYCSKSTFDGSC